MDVKLELLVELYKFSFYYAAETTYDPRTDIKNTMILNIENNISNNVSNKQLTQIINDFRIFNEMLKGRIDNLFDFLEEINKFYEENPNTKI